MIVMDSGTVREGCRLDVDAVVSKVMALFPGAEVLCEDMYEAERLRKLELLDKLKRIGRPTDPELVLHSIANKEVFFGAAKSMRIPSSNGSVLAIIRERHLTFHIESSFDIETKNNLLSMYKELGLSVKMHESE